MFEVRLTTLCTPVVYAFSCPEMSVLQRNQVFPLALQIKCIGRQRHVQHVVNVAKTSITSPHRRSFRRVHSQHPTSSRDPILRNNPGALYSSCQRNGPLFVPLPPMKAEGQELTEQASTTHHDSSDEADNRSQRRRLTDSQQQGPGATQRRPAQTQPARRPMPTQRREDSEEDDEEEEGSEGGHGGGDQGSIPHNSQVRGMAVGLLFEIKSK